MAIRPLESPTLPQYMFDLLMYINTPVLSRGYQPEDWESIPLVFWDSSLSHFSVARFMKDSGFSYVSVTDRVDFSVVNRLSIMV